MKSLNYRGDKTTTGHHILQNEASSTANELYLIKFLAKGWHENPQIIQAIAKAFGSSPQTDNKALLLKRQKLYNSLNTQKLSSCIARAFTPMH